MSWNLQHGAGRWICGLLVLVAAIHAALPSGEPLIQHSGSAFSASTSDVAVNCAGRVEQERQALPDKAKPPPPCCTCVQTPVASLVPAQGLRDGRHARAPPVADFALLPVNPRAPPAA